MLQIRYFITLAGQLGEACHVDVRPERIPAIATFPRAIRCLQSLQNKTGDLLVSCAQSATIEQVFESKSLSIASVIGLTHELCHSLGLRIP